MGLTPKQKRLVERARTIYDMCRCSDLAEAPPDEPTTLEGVVETLLCAIEDLNRRIDRLENPSSTEEW